jgi:transcriptional regulator with XRE-family HTH domain
MADVVETIAGRLRALRAARGLSMAELARASGVSKAALSQLESGKGNPTIETLCALAGVLQVPLGELISQTPGRSVWVTRAGEGARISGAAVDARLMHRFWEGGASFEFYDLVIRAGAVQESAAHPPGVVEYLVVHEGELEAGPLDETVALGPGDFVVFAADRPHVYEALGGPVRTTLQMRYPAGR